jgi:transcriptional regulator with XRE-family HTH domain
MSPAPAGRTELGAAGRGAHARYERGGGAWRDSVRRVDGVRTADSVRRVGGVRTADRPAFGALLREWRQRRRVSQLDLAIAADVSARHVSFLETGRSRPSREMVLRLAERLDVPLRDRNPLLLAAGYAPSYPRRALDDPAMAPVRDAVAAILAGYEPYPALVVDRSWNLVSANAGVAVLTAAAAAPLREPPVNVLRLSLHPDGLAPHITNLPQWRGHVLGRLAREAAAGGDGRLAALHRELAGYPGGVEPAEHPEQAVAVPLRVRLGGRELAFISTVTTFGTALDITAAELSIEAFLPADAATADALRSA